MDHNLHDRFCTSGNAAIDSADRYWEPWLSMWRTGSLLLVEPWDNAMRAFAERAQLLPHRMAALDLDRDTLARVEPSTVRELVERCTTCESPEQCAWDLRQDPADPAWQAYCPNAAKLMALARLPQFGIRTTEETPHTTDQSSGRDTTKPAPLLSSQVNLAEHAHAVRNAPGSSNTEKTSAARMHIPARPEPQIHLFCPSCGESTAITAIGPTTFEPSMEEITYRCAGCGTETKVKIAKHARFSVDLNEARYVQS
jgi:Family of unknown function (DUF6455)